MESLEAVNQRRTVNTMAKDKRTNIDLQNTTQKTKDRATCTHLKTREDLISFGMVAFPA